MFYTWSSFRNMYQCFSEIARDGRKRNQFISSSREYNFIIVSRSFNYVVQGNGKFEIVTFDTMRIDSSENNFLPTSNNRNDIERSTRYRHVPAGDSKTVSVKLILICSS